jgi:hypothetical protein
MGATLLIRGLFALWVAALRFSIAEFQRYLFSTAPHRSRKILAGIIERKKRLNRMVELQGKVALNVHELREFQLLRQEFRQNLHDLARQIAQERGI